MRKKPIEIVFEAVGESNLARHFGISRQAVNKWRVEVPPKRVLGIVHACGGLVSAHDLRPDLYPLTYK